MSRGALGSEWQYAPGLITRNYRLLSLDIRHMCAYNQSSKPRVWALSIGFNSVFEPGSGSINHIHLVSARNRCYSIQKTITSMIQHYASFLTRCESLIEEERKRRITILTRNHFGNYMKKYEIERNLVYTFL